MNWVMVGGTGCATSTVALCGLLLPPAPVATAEYVVVCAGESLIVPAVCELLVTVREDVPAVAVIATEVALFVCQLRVTLWPSSMEPVLAEKTTVGAVAGTGGVGGFEFWLEEPVEHEHKAQKALRAKMRESQRKLILIIRCLRAAKYRVQRASILMPTRLCIVAFAICSIPLNRRKICTQDRRNKTRLISSAASVAISLAVSVFNFVIASDRPPLSYRKLRLWVGQRARRSRVGCLEPSAVPVW